jgi:uncharacterized membrane protein
MNRQTLFYALVFGISFLLGQGCAVDEGPFIRPPKEPDLSVVHFSTDIQTVFNSYCVSCHTDRHPKLNLLVCCSYAELTATGFSAPYIDTVTPTNSLLYKHVNGQSYIMPPSGKIPDEEIDKILKWIEQGAKNN